MTNHTIGGNDNYVTWSLELSFMWNTACGLIPPICIDKQVCKPFTLLCVGYYTWSLE